MGTEPINSVWTLVHEHLEKAMDRVRDEIQNYPAPIPACDAQFNYLLERREALSSELTRVREFMNEDTVAENARDSIDAFLNMSTNLGDAEIREIREIINNDNR